MRQSRASPRSRRAARHTDKQASAIQNSTASRTASCGGNSGTASAASAPLQYISGGFSTKGSNATLGTTQSPRSMMLSTMPNEYGSSAFHGARQNVPTTRYAHTISTMAMRQ